jgi:hypothetical protein
MKYGINHNNGVIIAISKFANDIIPEKFIEITQAKYVEFLNDLDINPLSTYDANSNTLVQDSAAYAALVRSNSKALLRDELRALSIELDLQTNMGEDTTANQSSFDAKKTQFNAF